MESRVLPSAARGMAACAVLGCLACGGSTPSAPSPPAATPSPARVTLAELSASASSREVGRVINCREDVTAQVALTNRAASAVAVMGVRRTTRVVSGSCGGTPDFVYARTPQLAGAGRTTVVMDEPLYVGGSGCCTSGTPCDGRFTCSIEQSFTALTTPGAVAAGSFTYQVNFLNCGECSQVSAAGRSAPLANPR